MKLHGFKFVPAISHPASGHHQKNLISFLLISGWTFPAPQSWKVLHSPQHCFHFFLDSVWCVPASQVLGTPNLDPLFQMYLSRAEKKGRITSLSLLVAFYLLHARILIIIFGMRVHFWLIVSLMSRRTPRFLSVELISGQPSDCTVSWHYPPHGTGLHISLCWVSWGSCQCISPAYWGPSEWQCNPLADQQCPPVFLFPLLFLCYLWLSLKAPIPDWFQILTVIQKFNWSDYYSKGYILSTCF